MSLPRRIIHRVLVMVIVAHRELVVGAELEVILQSQLAELELEIASKVDAKLARRLSSFAGVFAVKQAEINYLVERREHFDKLAKSRQNAIDRLKAYVKLAPERQGVNSQTIETELKDILNKLDQRFEKMDQRFERMEQGQMDRANITIDSLLQ